jgi:hypothetical protein
MRFAKRPYLRAIAVTLLFALLLSAAAIVPVPIQAQSRMVEVNNAAELYDAVSKAQPGDTILLLDGGANAYDMRNKISIDRAGAPDAPITVRAEKLEDAQLRFFSNNNYVEGFHVQAPHWRFENLDIIGMCGPENHDRCEHAYHIVGAADDIIIRGNRMMSFNAQIKANGDTVGPGGSRVFPDDVIVEGSELYNPTVRQTGNPVTPIDVVGGRRWIVRGNYIHDFAKGQGNGISYAAFFKGNSRDGIFERNLVVCEELHKGRTRLGLSFGGGGTQPESVCEDGTCTPEHQRGIMRNNIIANCPADVGVYVNKAADTQIHHNLLYNTGGGIDVRFNASQVDLQGNMMSGRIRERDGGKANANGNLENVTAGQFEDWFLAPGFLDFSLVDGSAFVDQGSALESVNDDFCANARDDGMPDIGVVEYDGDVDCDTTRAHPVGPPVVEPTPTLAPSATPAPTSTPALFFGGRVIDRESVDRLGIEGASVKITGCDQSTKISITDEVGRYGTTVIDPSFGSGCEVWGYEVTASGFLKHQEAVVLDHVHDKDFALFRQSSTPIYLPRLGGTN